MEEVQLLTCNSEKKKKSPDLILIVMGFKVLPCDMSILDEAVYNTWGYF